MKTAIYIEDGMTQLVITPETEFEKKSMGIFLKQPIKAELFEGGFYDCRGGWVRQTAHFNKRANGSPGLADDVSLILKAATKEKK